MRDSEQQLLALSDKFSNISAGCLFKEKKILITGHENGYVVKWNLQTQEQEIILRTSSTVHAIQRVHGGEVYVGCQAGDLYRLYGSDLRTKELIVSPTGSVRDRVFRLMELTDRSVLTSSTYGALNILSNQQNEWTKTSVPGHQNAVFAMARHSNSLLATGDYRGHIRIWNLSGDGLTLRDRLHIDSYVSGLAFLGKNLLAAIGYSGHVYIFEYNEETLEWKTVFETETASGEGISINASNDDKCFYVATAKELFKIDPESQIVSSTKINGAIALFLEEENLLILCKRKVVRLPKSNLTTAEDLVRYRYIKIALVGDTSCGKTTLSSAIATGDPGSQLSTFGRKIWTWNVDNGSVKHKVILNDNGGQEQVLDTLLPLTIDSDIILYLFKQTDLRSFRNALKFHDKIKGLTSSRTMSYLVETHTDNELVGVTDEHILQNARREGFDRIFKLSAINIDEVEKFKNEILSNVDWGNARPVYQSVATAQLAATIDSLKVKGSGVPTVDEIKLEYEKVSGTAIYIYTLKFLLQNLSEAGLLEYFPDIGNRVILDDPNFNKLRTEVPVYVGEHDGLVDWKVVKNRFASSGELLVMLDRYYDNNGISIPFGEKRLFPALLADRPLRVPDKISRYVDEGELLESGFSSKETTLYQLLSTLSDLKLDCIDITKNEGLFAWGSRSYLYYLFEHTQSRRTGESIKFSYRVDGQDQRSSKSLERQFHELIESLYSDETYKIEV